ncbi:MAG: efflux RND transporter periplasmic adaptor subunit [Tannerellaceae bacterium]|nr:efflux RND transporter periplasmic adaptor subunit [Tannerellaceae bacterium]MCD8264069.1 efflux RND transporter periplasmic adaptor subunit [Tannerellaceae bacterium]
MTKKVLLWNLVLPVAILAACKPGNPEQESSAYYFRGDTVIITDNSVLTNRLKIQSVEEELYSKEVITAGTIQADPTRYAYIAPPFPGRVVRSHIKLGQEVNQHTPLFEIISPDFTSAQKEFFQAQSERELALKDMKRKEDLIKHGVSSQRELEEAANELMIVEKEYENAYAALQVYQTDPENMVLGQPLVIRAPIKGEVLENNLVTGIFLNTESEHVAVVADLSEVWVAAQVKEKDIRFIHVGDDMDIHISALPGEKIKGKVFHIEDKIDEETRSIEVLSVCNNKDRLLKLGMYATVHFIDEPVNTIIIPEKVLMQDEKYSFVFVQEAPGRFVKRPVEVETTINGKAIVTNGLRNNETIIAEGGYYLKQ